MKLEKVALDEPDSPVLYVEGADLMNGTPIFDIKPYIPYADCHPEATGSFTEYSKDHHLNVEFPKELLERIPGESREALIAVLADDPRPAYQIAVPAWIALHMAHSLQGLPFTGCSQLTAFARILATVVLPVPLVPQNRYAWPIRLCLI